MAKVITAVRLDPDLLRAMDRSAALRNESRTDWMTRAIRDELKALDAIDDVYTVDTSRVRLREEAARVEAVRAERRAEGEGAAGTFGEAPAWEQIDSLPGPNPKRRTAGALDRLDHPSVMPRPTVVEPRWKKSQK